MLTLAQDAWPQVCSPCRIWLTQPSASSTFHQASCMQKQHRRRHNASMHGLPGRANDSPLPLESLPSGQSCMLDSVWIRWHLPHHGACMVCTDAVHAGLQEESEIGIVKMDWTERSQSTQHKPRAAMTVQQAALLQKHILSLSQIRSCML